MSIGWRALDAFNHLGANARDKFAWSAQSDDRTITVLTLWQDEVTDDGHTVIANHMGSPTLHLWITSPRNRRRIRHLQDVWNGDRTFRVVMLQAKNDKAVPRSPKRRWPDEALIMTLLDFNPDTGEFRAEGTHA